MRHVLLIIIFALTAAPGCKKSHAAPRKGQPDTTRKTAAAPRPADKAPAAPPKSAKEAPTTEIKIASVSNLMKFDTTKLTVKTGANVHLVFHNNATLAVLPHNWVLVKPGTQADVAAAGLKLGKPAAYVAPGPDVLAFTPLAEAGKTVSITFKAPAPGTYPYICTVPGHYVVMHGELVVTP